MKKGKLELVGECDLCGLSETRQFIKTKDRNYGSGTFTYIQCVKCKLVWLSPRPIQSELYKYYPNVYRAYQPSIAPTFTQSIVRSFISNDLVSRFFIKDRLFHWKNKGKILDVGCASGQYMHILNSWGWDSYGVEISERAVKAGLKSGLKKLKQGTLRSAKYQANYFEAVRFSHVLEHVPSPKLELRETLRVLKPKGKIIILIPNIDSLFFRIFRSFWYPLEAPRHFYHYSPETISKYLRKIGFKNVQVSFVQSPYSLVRSLKYVYGIKNVEKRYGIVMYPLALIFRLFNILKISDSLEVVAVKK